MADHTGERYNSWTLVRFDHTKEYTNGNWRKSTRVAYWLCRCDCGREKVCSLKSIRQGLSRMCRLCASHAPEARPKLKGTYRKPSLTEVIDAG